MYISFTFTLSSPSKDYVTTGSLYATTERKDITLGSSFFVARGFQVKLNLRLKSKNHQKFRKPCSIYSVYELKTIHSAFPPSYHSAAYSKKQEKAEN